MQGKHKIKIPTRTQCLYSPQYSVLERWHEPALAQKLYIFTEQD